MSLPASLLVTLFLVCGTHFVAAQSAQDTFARAYTAYEQKNFAEAELLFRQGLGSAGDDAKLRGLASYYLAETLRQQNKLPAEATGLYQDTVRLIPGTDEARDAASKASSEPTGDKPTTLAFLRNGGWDGQVTAYKWKGINTKEAWAIGKASESDLREICRASSEGAGCVRRIHGQPDIEIFANCADGVAWWKDYPDRYKLSELVAGTKPESHRAQATVSSWFEMLCPTLWGRRAR